MQFLVRELKLLDYNLLLCVFLHFLINFDCEIIVYLTVLLQISQRIMLLVLLEHIILNLHHCFKTHFFELALDLVVLLLQFRDILFFSLDFALSSSQFILEILKLLLVCKLQLVNLFLKIGLFEHFFV